MQRRRTVKVIAGLSTLAVGGGLLVATGTDETVASFVDSAMAYGLFDAAPWNLQGNATSDVSPSSSGWDDHRSGSDAARYTSTSATFEPMKIDVSPGRTVYSRFALRLAPGSSQSGTGTMSTGARVGATSAATASAFRMRVVRSSTDTCDASSFQPGATFVVGSASNPAGTTMLSAPSDNRFELNPGSDGAAGPPLFFCFEFSLPGSVPSGLTNGAEARVQWTFNAQSAS